MKFENIILVFVGAAFAAVAWMLWDVIKGPSIIYRSSPQTAASSIDSSESLNQALGSGMPVLLEFYADWCPPCKVMGPEVDAFAKEVSGRAKVVRLNMDMFSIVAANYRVEVLPTFIAFDSTGRETSREVGLIPKEKLNQMLGL